MSSQNQKHSWVQNWIHFKDRRMFGNYKTEFDFSELSSSSSHNKACDAWGPPCHATMYSSSLLLNIPTLIIIHLFLQSRRWIAFTRQTILNDFRKWNFRWHFVCNIHTSYIAVYTYSFHYDDGPIASICIAYIPHGQLILSSWYSQSFSRRLHNLAPK